MERQCEVEKQLDIVVGCFKGVVVIKLLVNIKNGLNNNVVGYFV